MDHGPITPELMQAILAQYALRQTGIHGISHWARVLENSRRLAASTGARLEVVSLFAVFHDACRANDGIDRDHGARGADLATRLRGRWFDVSDEDFALLCQACIGHTDGKTDADPTIQTCWDSDRLDLYRVGILPRADRLCTPAARLPETLAWANERAQRRAHPDLIATEWNLRV